VHARLLIGASEITATSDAASSGRRKVRRIELFTVPVRRLYGVCKVLCGACAVYRRGRPGWPLLSYKYRGALRGTPGSACPQPEPNATELPSCARISARAAQRRRRRRRWRGEEGARRPGPEGQVLRHVLWHVLRSALRRVLGVPVLHVSTKGGCEGGGGGAAVRVAARSSILFFLPSKGLRSPRPLPFTCPPFTSRPPLSLGLPHQQRVSNVQKAPGVTMKKLLMKKPLEALGGGQLGAGHGRGDDLSAEEHLPPHPASRTPPRPTPRPSRARPSCARPSCVT